MSKIPLNLESFWMPFTDNRDFKSAPRMLASAKGMYYYGEDGSPKLDAAAGLWCTNAGHGRAEIANAVSQQLLEMDFAPCFQIGHSLAFEYANRLTALTPGDLNHVFFTNSGSEAVDTALKIALAWHKRRGDGSRQLMVGREKAYHGVGFGGISVGGLGANRNAFGSFVPSAYLPDCLNIHLNAFTAGLPEHGAELADNLEKIVSLHGADRIAAVIVEPVSGAGGVIMPPKGYLQRLRELCDRHGILLIFDEVITGFGRLGASFAAERFGVVPDIMTTAKGITNGTIPLGAVFVRDKIYARFMENSARGVELCHGYTYSAHPVACAAGMATLDIYKREGLLTRAQTIEPYWHKAMQRLQDAPRVIDTRSLGLIAAIQFQPIKERPGTIGLELLKSCFENGLMVRALGDTIALSPSLIVTEDEIDIMVDIILRQIQKLY